MKIIKNKFNEYSFAPSFEGGKVYFYKITNPELAQEGQDWDFVVLKELSLNKVDKKGQPMFLREVKLIEPEVIETKIIYKLLQNGEETSFLVYRKNIYNTGKEEEKYIGVVTFQKGRCIEKKCVIKGYEDEIEKIYELRKKEYEINFPDLPFRLIKKVWEKFDYINGNVVEIEGNQYLVPAWLPEIRVIGTTKYIAKSNPKIYFSPSQFNLNYGENKINYKGQTVTINVTFDQNNNFHQLAGRTVLQVSDNFIPLYTGGKISFNKFFRTAYKLYKGGDEDFLEIWKAQRKEKLELIKLNKELMSKGVLKQYIWNKHDLYALAEDYLS